MSHLVHLTVLLLVGILCLGATSAKPHEEINRDHAAELANECKAETGATDGESDGHQCRKFSREYSCQRTTPTCGGCVRIVIVQLSII